MLTSAELSTHRASLGAHACQALNSSHRERSMSIQLLWLQIMSDERDEYISEMRV
jgi:hypothetical protein